MSLSILFTNIYQASVLVFNIEKSESVSHSIMSNSFRPHGLQPARLSVHGILQARILEWAAIPSSGDLPDPGIEPGSPALHADSLPCEPPGDAVVKKPPANAGDTRETDLIPGSGRSPEEGRATHSTIPAWEIPWTKESGRQQSISLQRVRHD